MKTPICDFVKKYIRSGTSRLHMPGHKGKMLLGFEKEVLGIYLSGHPLEEYMEKIKKNINVAKQLMMNS